MPQAYMLVGGIPCKHDPQNYTQITHVLRTYYRSLRVCVCVIVKVCALKSLSCVSFLHLSLNSSYLPFEQEHMS